MKPFLSSDLTEVDSPSSLSTPGKTASSNHSSRRFQRQLAIVSMVQWWKKKKNFNLYLTNRLLPRKRRYPATLVAKVPNLELLKGSKTMKDKLVKNGHKGIYYFIRRLCIGVAVSASLVAAI